VIRPEVHKRTRLTAKGDWTRFLAFAARPDGVPLTLVGRLEAMEKRLEAMLQAANWCSRHWMTSTPR
jgi:hypothetical protein